MDLDDFRPADLGSLAAVALSLVVGLVALPTLPGEVAIQWAADGSPNTVLPAIPGVLLTPTIALLAFAYLQVALVALNLGVAVSPLVAVAPAVVAVLAATYAERIGSESVV